METTNLNIHAALRMLATAMEENDQSEIIRQLEALAVLGRPQTYESIAATYEFGGISVTPRDDLAYEWHMRSALEQDNCESYFSIGRYYFHGKGVKKDLTQSTHYYEIAHHKGSHIAGIMLAARYISGDGVPIDLERAEQCLAPARAEGYVAAAVLQSKIEFRRKHLVKGVLLWIQGIWGIVRFGFSDPQSRFLYGLKTEQMINDDIAIAKKQSIEWSERH